MLLEMFVVCLITKFYQLILDVILIKTDEIEGLKLCYWKNLDELEKVRSKVNV